MTAKKNTAKMPSTDAEPPAKKTYELNDKENITVTLNGGFWFAILNVLPELPGKICNPITNDISAQITKHFEAKEKLINAK